MNPQLLAVAVENIPGIVALLKSAFAKKHPDQPQPSGAEIVAAYEQAFRDDLAADDAYLNSHPG